ncbi:MAG: NAD(P)/FAD-dependent oxidoreductase [Acidobacteria bacterium]|nr:NAD(P)/FAD-dependent oxidoreductase [Acidobacteriota bacterium]
MKADVIIIGGGAAGLFCAIAAGRRGRRVLVVEHNAEVGRKIVISGGGRCNFTNLNTTAENFVSRNPHFARSALARYTPTDFVELVKRHRIEYYEKKLGQLFCRGRSHEIVDMLLAECRTSRVEIKTDTSVERIEKDKHFVVRTSRGIFESEALVIATGGPSFPKIGATGFGYGIARQFGLAIEETRPSLVPLVFSGANEFRGLAGISIDAEVTAGAHSFRENILFTHRGLSGPAILQASNYWSPGGEVEFNLLPAQDIATAVNENRRSRQRLDNFLKGFLPERFVEIFTAGRLPQKPLNELSNRDIEMIEAELHRWRRTFTETEGWDKAEVTFGGVSTRELSSQTMEAKRVPGLYFIGEVVDVTGWLGGYNFQWAWASGHAAGTAV